MVVARRSCGEGMQITVVKLWLVGEIYSVHIVEVEVRFGQTNVSKLICYDFVGVDLLILLLVGRGRSMQIHTKRNTEKTEI